MLFFVLACLSLILICFYAYCQFANRIAKTIMLGCIVAVAVLCGFIMGIHLSRDGIKKVCEFDLPPPTERVVLLV